MKNLLQNPQVLEWCQKGITEFSLINTSKKDLLKASKKIEDEWGSSIIGNEGNGQWTTRFCESLVKEALIALGRKNVRRTEQKKSLLRNKKYDPDLECDEFVYEVKGRTWNTSGTAGEKILGVPLKYAEIPKLYGKPLKIILVGYQEWEARNAFAFGDLLDEQNQIPQVVEALGFYKKRGIEYIGFTDILKELALIL